MPINNGDPFLVAMMRSGKVDEITPSPYEPLRALTAFLTESIRELFDCNF